MKMVFDLQPPTQFDLQKPSYVPDDLDEDTTNESIEIEIVGVADTMEELDHGPVRFD